ncbi:GIP [Symbiodinium microadriaticum]|nr:GIP [Symbiodinium microadriaticum]
MDTLARKRRSAGVGDVEEASGAAEKDYETALGQAEFGANSGGGVSGTLLNGVVGGEASPGTLESGEARAKEIAPQLPSANPFHSERVKAEVELIRNRPTSLDEDARRAVREYDDSALGGPVGTFCQEPDYAAVTGDGAVARDAPRVARVEPSPGEPSPAMGLEDPLGAASDLGGVNVSKGPSGLGLGEQRAGISGRDTGTGEEDGRELIPAEDRFERMEALLLQVMEENRSLKRRLDQQAESRSHSSYHSGLATADQALSPATFGPRCDDGFWFYGYGKQGEWCSARGSGILGRFAKSWLDYLLVWLVADPLGRLAVDPASVKGEYDEYLHRLGIDYNPTVASVLQLVKLIQAEGITEDADLKSQSAGSANATISSASTIPSQEALVAEATKLLKGVALRAIGVGDDPDWSWIRSALASASNPEYCLIDSGATNALRPAEAEELRAGKVIRVDLASGTTELRINEFGTLLHGGQCQVILPASYLVDLGYSISWKRKGCTVKHPKRGKLQVVVVKGCPLIPRDVGLDLLQAYEGKKAGKPLLSKAEVEDLGSSLGIVEVRGWLKDRVQLRAKDGISDVDQLVFLRAMFPGVPLKFLARACVAPLSSENVDWAELPWNRRLRRSIDRAEEGSVLVAVSLVFQALMKWAHSGVIGGETVEVTGPLEKGYGLHEAVHEIRADSQTKAALELIQAQEVGFSLAEVGQSWDVEASGRDRGKGYKYFLACAYAVPEKYMPVVPAEDDTGEYAPSECGELLPVSPNEADTSALDQFQGEDIFGDLWDLPEPGLHAVTHRVKGKRPESGTGELGPEAESSSASGVVPGGDPTSGGPVKGHRTLFFGVPLRTKRGKEVFPSIQGVINRLEAAGFPVQRFHADRAKELRTTALTSWLKHQGIHPTWTAGESPAGNRAELAVQNLKGFVRKLLCIADLSKSYWPLALHHASTRNWFDFCEVAGKRSPHFSVRVVAAQELPGQLTTAGEFVVVSKDSTEGAESLSVKVALIFAAGHPSWTGVTIDVKSAFLYAPIRSDSKGVEERIIVKPPSFLLELGIMTRDDRWWIRKALYGLPTSPRDWGRYRDAEFTKFCLRWGKDEYHLVQTLSDDALWLARKVTKSGYGDTEGILVVYVDDLAFLAPRGLGEAFVAAVQERWKTSTPEWFSERPLTFCGMELSQHGHGYRMSQSAYVRELLGRYGIEESASTPITRWTEPEALAYLRTERVLELYTDASHSPCGGRSVQGIFLLWQGVPVTWESSRQSFVTLSSAEAELVTMISGLQAAEAVLPLVQELVEQDVTISLLADNEAAIRAFDTAPASWRSRHLRMRAFAARERISANILRVTHLPGQYQIADIATKPLVLSPEGCLTTVEDQESGDEFTAHEWAIVQAKLQRILAYCFLGVEARSPSALEVMVWLVTKGHVFANAVAEGFRKGPHAIRFQGAQWMMAVEEYLHTGYPETEREDAEDDPTIDERSLGEALEKGECVISASCRDLVIP